MYDLAVLVRSRIVSASRMSKQKLFALPKVYATSEKVCFNNVKRSGRTDEDCVCFSALGGAAAPGVGKVSDCLC